MQGGRWQVMESCCVRNGNYAHLWLAPGSVLRLNRVVFVTEAHPLWRTW